MSALNLAPFFSPLISSTFFCELLCGSSGYDAGPVTSWNVTGKSRDVLTFSLPPFPAKSASELVWWSCCTVDPLRNTIVSLLLDLFGTHWVRLVRLINYWHKDQKLFCKRRTKVKNYSSVGLTNFVFIQWIHNHIVVFKLMTRTVLFSVQNTWLTGCAPVSWQLITPADRYQQDRNAAIRVGRKFQLAKWWSGLEKQTHRRILRACDSERSAS